MADVALRNVVKRFDDVDAVRDISLTFPTMNLSSWWDPPAAERAPRCA